MVLLAADDGEWFLDVLHARRVFAATHAATAATDQPFIAVYGDVSVQTICAGKHSFVKISWPLSMVLTLGPSPRSKH